MTFVVHRTEQSGAAEMQRFLEILCPHVMSGRWAQNRSLPCSFKRLTACYGMTDRQQINHTLVYEADY